MIPLPREYQQMLRGPRFAWWRPPLTIAMAVVFAFVVALLIIGVDYAVSQTGTLRSAFSDKEMSSPLGFALGNLMLAALIPMAMLSTRIMHGVGPGYLSSVAGRIRWRWLLSCAAIVVLPYLITNGVDLLVNGPQGIVPDQQGLLLLLVLTTTPLQAAGEEYLCRGVIMQNVGAWFRNRRVAVVAATTASTGVFVALHGSADIWIVIDLALTGLACSILTWRTGGLEAAIVLHSANNVIGMVVTILVGGWGEGFVDENSVGKPQDALLTLLVTGTVVVLFLRQARRQGIQRAYQPAEPVGSDAVGSRRMTAALWSTIAAPPVLLVLMLVVGVALLLSRSNKPLRTLRYTEIAATMGITPQGCFGGQLIAALPVEIRRYQARTLVEDDVHIEIGGQRITGSSGIFQFPISGVLMVANPTFLVVQPDGKAIAYRFRFLRSSVPSLGKCPTQVP